MSSMYNLKASTTKGRDFKWTTFAIVFVLIIAVFTADLMFLGQSGEPQISWLCNLAQIFAFVTSSHFSLDCSISVCLIAGIAFKSGYCRPSTGSRTDIKTKQTTGANSNKVIAQKAHVSEDGSASKRGVSATGLQSGGASERPVIRWNQAIDLAARQGDSKKAGRLLMEFEQISDGKPGNCPDNVSYNLVIRSCAKRCDFKGAEQWLARMESKGVEATVCSYNTVLDACAKADNAEACDAWLEEMARKGVEANVISYATALYAWARRGEEGRAEAWMNKMLAEGIVPDAVSYNSLIHACGVSGHAAGAERWLLEMQAAGLEATVTSFTSVMDAAAKAGDIPRAEKWLEAMISAKVEPNVVSFCAVIDACAKASDVPRAEHWHNRMIECGIPPNAYSFSAVINACSRAGDVERAEGWLEKSEKSGIPNDVVVYSSVIDACSKAGDAERAMAIFKRIHTAGLRPHIVAYAALARPFAYRGDWETVESIADELTSNGLKPNEYFIYAQLLSYSTARPRQAERAEQCFRKAMKMHLQANDHVVGALSRAVGRDHCEELMAELCNGRAIPMTGNGRSMQPRTGNDRARQAARMPSAQAQSASATTRAPRG